MRRTRATPVANLPRDYSPGITFMKPADLGRQHVPVAAEALLKVTESFQG